jgi:hypothetical protein
MIPHIIYGLCALTAFMCCCLLLLAYARSGYRLLFWGGICFVGLTINNIFVILDELVILSVDLSVWRLLPALLAMSVLIYGLIWDNE